MSITGRVLLIEDRADWRKQLSRYLRQEGHSFETVETYHEALAVLDRQTFDVVLVDLRLVDWDDTNYKGLELLPRIDELRKENGTQAIIVTAHPTSENIREAFQDHDISDFLLKSDLNSQRFKQAVGKAVGKAQEERDKILRAK